jgi:predicted kinase
MEAIIFCGIQASGKSTFYRENFFKTHVRISLDLFNTRRKEAMFIQTSLDTQQRFVIDNTNPTKKDRQVYIERAKKHHFKVIAYYFHSTIGEAITRNKNRTGKDMVPVAGIGGTLKKLQLPAFEEGFDEIFRVEIAEGKFLVTKVETDRQAT